MKKNANRTIEEERASTKANEFQSSYEQQQQQQLTERSKGY